MFPTKVGKNSLHDMCLILSRITLLDLITVIISDIYYALITFIDIQLKVYAIFKKLADRWEREVEIFSSKKDRSKIFSWS